MFVEQLLLITIYTVLRGRRKNMKTSKFEGTSRGKKMDTNNYSGHTVTNFTSIHWVPLVYLVLCRELGMWR